VSDCCFCPGNLATPGDLGDLAPRIGWYNDHFYLTPTIGELADRHSLLIPWSHVPSFAQLPATLSAEAEDLLARHCEAGSSERNKVIVFEHGMSSHVATGGCGISHAHIHLVPVPREFEIGEVPKPDAAARWTELPPEGWLKSLAELDGYLMLGCEGRFQAREVENLPSQYLRRWLADRLGRSQWDWRQAEPCTLPSRAQRLRQRYVDLDFSAAA
jgi:diadenosine tetraphosphate (Ap4A) HIT family hydrolase